MANTPNIRFKGFTDNWEQRKLGTIITEKLSNGVINKSGLECSSVKHINVINMYTYDRIHTEDLSSSSYDENVIQKCNVEVGDIFMTRSSLKPEGIAEANILLDSGRYVFDDHLIRMKVDRSKYDPMFVKINLGNRMIKAQFIMKSKTTAFTTIGQEDIAECEGMFPCLAEQKKISEYFQQLDHLVTLHQRKCDVAKEFKKYMLQKMFPQNGKKISEIRFAGFTDAWEQRKLGDVFEEYSEKNHLELPPLTIIQGGGTVLREESDRNLQYDRSSLSGYKMVRKNDFIVHLRSFEGGLEKANSDGVISPAYYTFHGVDTDSRFYYPFFRSRRFIDDLLKPHVYGIRDGKSIDINGMKKIMIPVPSYEEQRKIGGYIEGIDNLIALHQRKCNELKQVKKFMLKNMFPQKG